MELHTYRHDRSYDFQNVRTEVVLETSFSKEIRILLPEGKSLKEHTAPHPIVVHLLEGEIDFGINGSKNRLIEGDILTLEAKVPHDLLALQNSSIRLTISRKDQAERVAEVAKNS